MRLHRELWNRWLGGWVAVAMVLVAVRPVTAQQPRLLGELGEPASAFMEAAQTIVFSPDGKWLAHAFQGKVRLYDVAQRTLHVEIAAHKESWTTAAFSPDSQVLASGVDVDKALIRLWDVATGEKIREFNGSACHALVFDPTGKYLATTATDCDAAVWNYETSKRAVTVGGAAHGPTKMLALTPDGKTLATLSEYGVSIWHPHAGKGDKLQFVITSNVGKRGVPVSPPKKAPIRPSQLLFSSMAISPDGKTVACCGGDKNRVAVEWWDLESQQISNTLTQDEPATKTGGIKRLAFSPGGNTMFTLQVAVHGWDAETGRSLFVLDEPKKIVANAKGGKQVIHGYSNMAVSADGRMLATAGSNLPIRLWDFGDGASQPQKRVRKRK